MGAGGLPLAAWADVIVAYPLAFAAGVLVGWLISNRWAIVKRPPPRRATDPPGHDYTDQRGTNGT